MAFDSDAVIEATDVALYVATAPAAKPGAYDTAAELAAFDWDSVPAQLSAGSGTGNEYSLLGHLAEETAVALTPNVTGGDLRNSKHTTGLRQGVTRVTWQVTFPMLQLDNAVLAMVFGGGTATGVDTFDVGKKFVPAQRTLFAVFADAASNLAMHIPLVSAVPNGDLAFAGGDGLTTAAIQFSILDEPSVTALMSFIRDGLGVSA